MLCTEEIFEFVVQPQYQTTGMASVCYVNKRKRQMDALHLMCQRECCLSLNFPLVSSLFSLADICSLDIGIGAVHEEPKKFHIFI